jgi:hypothetical protein
MAKIYSNPACFFTTALLLCAFQLFAQEDGLIAPAGTTVADGTGANSSTAIDANGVTTNPGLPVLEGRYITLRGCTPTSLTFDWAVPNNTDNVKLQVRRNNQIVATRFLTANDSTATLTGLVFEENDRLYASITIRTQVYSMSAKYRNSLQDGQRSANTEIAQPLATVESVHPRRRTQARTLSNTAPLSCTWLTNAELNDRIYYKRSDVEACLNVPEADSLTFYTCLAAHTAYFTADSDIYSCNPTTNDGATFGTRAAHRNIVATPTPNPFVSGFDLSFQLPEDTATLQLQVIDMAGKTVHSQTQTKLTAGNYSLNIPTAHLPQGIYTYLLLTDTVVAQGRVLKID